ncbi:hypothetical protein V8F63_01415 [Brevundimonas sp. LF-1]|uniref:hypothetical protein n=1 Tax=Brevundimonas sp. LF-1 TaxID=3126100 RepID=UPI0030DDE27A
MMAQVLLGGLGGMAGVSSLGLLAGGCWGGRWTTGWSLDCRRRGRSGRGWRG